MRPRLGIDLNRGYGRTGHGLKQRLALEPRSEKDRPGSHGEAFETHIGLEKQQADPADFTCLLDRPAVVVACCSLAQAGRGFQTK